MKRYSVITKNGFEKDLEFQFSSEEKYEEAKKLYLDHGWVEILGNLIERHHKPEFRVTGDTEVVSLTEGIFKEDTIEADENAWRSEVLNYSLKRIFARKKPFATYWHYKAAQRIAGTWNFADTVSVLKMENFETLSEDARGLETYHKENFRPRKPGCGKCEGGWITNHVQKTAYPCECKPHIREEVLKYVASHRT